MRKERETSFLTKSILFFRSVKSRIVSARLVANNLEHKRELAGYKTENAPREVKLAYALDVIRTLALILLCIFLVCSLIFAGGIISYENVYYMFKDIAYSQSFSETPPEALNYAKPVNNQAFADFKNGLAVAGDSEIKFFTSEGRMTLTSGSSYTNPKITCSDHFALIYDQGSRSYAIYNSFIMLHSETLEQPISFADMAADGSFCLVTEAKNYGSEVRIYDSSFRLVTAYQKKDYVLSASMSENGKYAAILSLDAADGQSFVSLNVLRIGDGEIYSTAHLYDQMPYIAVFLGNDRIAVICEKLVMIYDQKGNVKSEYAYPAQLTHMSLGKDGFALAFSENAIRAGTVITAFDTNGRMTLTASVGEYITDLSYQGGSVYVLCNNRLMRMGIGSNVTRELELHEEDARVVAFENGTVMVCTTGTAYYVSFELLKFH